MTITVNIIKRKISMIVVHCTDTDGGTVESIRHYHINVRGYKDIGYHYLILRDGTIELGRPIDEPGAHAVGYNEHSIGVALIGQDKNPKEHPFMATFTMLQILSLKKLLTTLKEVHEIDDKEVYCHNVLNKEGKTCPGFKQEELERFLKL